MNDIRDVDSEFHINPMKSRDIDEILAIQKYAYSPSLHETREVFAARISVYPAGCRIATKQGQGAGYLISHPWISDALPDLNTVIVKLPLNPNCYYIHDLVVRQNYQGHGLARRLFHEALRLAGDEGLSKITLVAVNNSSSFWSKQGFCELDDHSTKPGLVLQHYGADSKFMVKNL